MVILELKPCCYNCACPNIEAGHITQPYVGSEDNINCIIRCTHSKVCKQYIESEE